MPASGHGLACSCAARLRCWSQAALGPWGWLRRCCHERPSRPAWRAATSAALLQAARPMGRAVARRLLPRGCGQLRGCLSASAVFAASLDLLSYATQMALSLVYLAMRSTPRTDDIRNLKAKLEACSSALANAPAGVLGPALLRAGVLEHTALLMGDLTFRVDGLLTRFAGDSFEVARLLCTGTALVKMIR